MASKKKKIKTDLREILQKDQLLFSELILEIRLLLLFLLWKFQRHINCRYDEI